MKLYVICDAEQGFRDFVSRNGSFVQFEIEPVEKKAVGLALGKVLAGDEAALVAYDHVVFPRGFKARVAELLARLNETYEAWGVVSNAGRTIDVLGAEEIVHRTGDQRLRMSKQGLWPAESLSGDVFLINAPLLRAKGLPSLFAKDKRKFPRELSAGSLQNGCAALISDLLIVGCLGSGDWPDDNQDSAGPEDAGAEAFKLREPPSLAIVVRSQFKRPPFFLRRCLESIRSFIDRSSGNARICFYLVTDNNDFHQCADSYGATDQTLFFECKERDTRFELIRNSVKELTEDYVWFVDDDDFVFPEAADRIGRALSAVEKGKTFYLDSQYFEERVQDDQSSWVSLPKHVMSGREYRKNRYISANHVPFCGVIFPRPCLAEELDDRTAGSVVYYEDFLCQLLVMGRRDFSPVIIGALATGISVRPAGQCQQTICLSDRTEWVRSSAELCSVMQRRVNPLFYCDETGPEITETRPASEPCLEVNEPDPPPQASPVRIRKSKLVSARFPAAAAYAHRMRDALRVLRGKKA